MVRGSRVRVAGGPYLTKYKAVTTLVTVTGYWLSFSPVVARQATVLVEDAALHTSLYRAALRRVANTDGAPEWRMPK